MCAFSYFLVTLSDVCVCVCVCVPLYLCVYVCVCRCACVSYYYQEMCVMSTCDPVSHRPDSLQVSSHIERFSYFTSKDSSELLLYFRFDFRLSSNATYVRKRWERRGEWRSE